MTKKLHIQSPEDYISHQESMFREPLEKLRIYIKEAAPKAIELMSYQIICFKHHYMLVGISANKNFCSFHTMDPNLVSRMKLELKGIKVSGTTLHFYPNETLPKELIQKIIAERVLTNEKKASARKDR